MRRVLRALSSVLIVSGVLLIVDAGITLAWQEPVSAFLANRQQSKLADQFEQVVQAQPTPVQRRALAQLRTDRHRIAFLAREARRKAVDGDVFGRLRIPAIGVDSYVVNGTAPDDLRKGPGHYPDTTFPGLGGTVAIAGHRTTYLAPFRKIDELGRGDELVLRMSYGTFTYVYDRQQIVKPTATYVTRDVGYDQLVLSACHPLYSAAERIIVYARLKSVRPRDAADRS
ncbi:class E sortase [Conexibacter sp. JD483]|uniref:class E sortase n=1 Tax=unclassified Conexibacter TaxID=2627773 RepID=UPI0027254691|nr:MULTISPECIES: class E sortase [unclassified Conexibacter]MDO8184395.1 class E sortase [Conexibacter sp. CPCC 205706]MDO8197701.1 class E sortase [Conexibacter sp. CPCC 205762]MDR9368364.1 class E sortase [Conexibacter sp. JD483]